MINYKQRGSVSILAIVAIISVVIVAGIGVVSVQRVKTPIVQQPAVTQTVHSPEITVEAPEITVEAPNITVEAPTARELVTTETEDESFGRLWFELERGFPDGLTVSGDAAFGGDTLYVDISADGVGIGTTTPLEGLHFENEILKMGDGCIYFSTTTDDLRWSDDCATFQVFQASSSADGWSDDGTYVRLTNSTDRVGVGTTTPSVGLHVGVQSSSHSINGAGDDVIINGQLEVDGVSYFDSTLTVAATSSFATTVVSYLEANSLTHLHDTLTVDGTSALVGTTTITQGLTVNGGLITLGSAAADEITINGTPTFGATSTFSVGLTANGNVILGDAVGDAITINGILTATNATSTFATTVIAYLEVNSLTHLHDTLTVDATTTITGSLAANGDVRANDLVTAGAVTALADNSGVTITSTEICHSNIITQTPTTSITMILPATTTLYADCLTTNGDTRTVLFRNAATANGTSTITAGNGIELIEPSNGDVIIEYTEYALIEFRRISAQDTVVTVTSLQDAD